MNKLIITRWNQFICTALAKDQKILQVNLDLEEEARLNSIYIGKVKNIRKNINAAFVEIKNGLTGYYSLSDNKQHLYVNGPSSRALKEGDEILVQISREAVKTKAPVLTAKLTFSGKLTVLMAGKNGIGFSSKISDLTWKQKTRLALKEALENETEKGRGQEDYGIIIRTNGKDATVQELLNEIFQLREICRQVMQNAHYRCCYSLLYQGPAFFLAGIRDAYADQLEEIVTDDFDLYGQIASFLEKEQPEDVGKLRLYEDGLLSLGKLYSLDSVMEGAMAKRVWLKSGGYLVIEPTEALVVIDVNTGKYSGKKTMEETIFRINIEAAEEIGRQLRLRNLSGIIIVDFIDMTISKNRQLLLERLDAVVHRDPIKTTVIGITKLNLVELTRKKLHKPLYEQLNHKSMEGAT